MVSSDGWKDDEHAKFCLLLLATWELERTLSPNDRSSQSQIWSQISIKLGKAGFNRGAHACKGHWYYVVRGMPEFRDTFPFQDKPLPNTSRRSEMAMGVDASTAASGGLNDVLDTAKTNLLPNLPTPQPALDATNIKLQPSLPVARPGQNYRQHLAMRSGLQGMMHRYSNAGLSQQQPSQNNGDLRETGSGVQNKKHQHSTIGMSQLQSSQEQNDLRETEPEVKTKKHHSTVDTSQKLPPPASSSALMSSTSKKPAGKWTDQEQAKLEEFVNAEIKAIDLRSASSRLEGSRFFEVVSKQLVQAGVDRSASACLTRWRRVYPHGNELEKEDAIDEYDWNWLAGENEQVDDGSPQARTSSKFSKWSKEEKKVLGEYITECSQREKSSDGSVKINVEWDLVKEKHDADGYDRTIRSMQEVWRLIKKAKDNLNTLVLQARASEDDSDDDIPLSQVKLKKFRAVSNKPIKSLSFDQATPTPQEVQNKFHTIPKHEPNPIKKRNHSATLSTVSDEEAAAQELKPAKRIASQAQDVKPDLFTESMESKVKQFEKEIANLEKDAADAPQAIQIYESKLSDIDSQIEKLRKQKEDVQAAKMEKLQVMTDSGKKIEKLKLKKAKLEGAMAIMCEISD